ncbi:hypothetical protein N8J89_16855 [Crossiella sp. CA-258035]|uniref:hypothetical protein n=1 Tax=Crossiella sp. CA-258035 TaxID=2981138 RepID=UPI0024BC559E|nr:hypothetical protein [Crossiella sp. CA-258035]WHT22667.1 hypothetical protein N8J89_16855 [Crossiella sp. CA-258035]
MKQKIRAGVTLVLSMAVSMAATAGIASAANKVNVSANDGSGTATATAWGMFRGAMTGQLKSTGGKKVYIEGLIVFDGNTDQNCGRMTGDVTSTSLVNVSGDCAVNPQVGRPSGMKFRVCTNRSGLPDPCGSWSAKSS